MHEIIKSVGIDIGTSTTQLIFSELTIENEATSYVVPRINIVDKKVTYRSKIYFTPLIDQQTIDAESVKKIIEKEYSDAGMKPEDLSTGAVIITGETARKTNANTVLETLSSMAGDFVVATAGPDLESVLSARGAGADTLSKEKRQAVANLDIGGGTSNIAVFQNGNLRGTSCLDVGGRLIKIDEAGKIYYIFPGTQALAKAHGISINVGDRADEKVLYKVCELMAEQLAMAINKMPVDDMHSSMYTNNGKKLSEDPVIDAVTYSGGVASVYYEGEPSDVFAYHDVGVLLARAIKNNPVLKNVLTYPAVETIRATVVGAGTHTTNVSGSTIQYTDGRLPIKNIPVLKLSEEDEQNPEVFRETLKKKLKLFMNEGHQEQVAIVLSGKYHQSFLRVQELANMIADGAETVISGPYPLIVVVENDIAKVLGNALNVLLERKKDFICIDGIFARDGDYIDIGEPVALGRVVPVVTKTLIFNS
ncbi:MAG: ethanolamine ammonia-lyase reactivating factor EutA [Eubacteriales bacterium]|nr:ethanolamine ammonia-lyase reactivating factor EutA [Eubacteriales bacterium]